MGRWEMLNEYNRLVSKRTSYNEKQRIISSLGGAQGSIIGAQAKEYNTFFHERSYAIDYSLGKKYGNGDEPLFSRKYVNDEGISLSDTVEAEVRKRVGKYINNYLNSISGLPKEIRDEVELSVTDAIMNQVDYDTYGKPDFKNEYGYLSSLCYDKVCKDLNKKLYDSSRDMYGAFTGNTVSGLSSNRTHPAIEIDSDSNENVDYSLYWIDEEYVTVNKEPGKISELMIELDNGEQFVETKDLDDPDLLVGDTFAEEIIYSDGNLVYSNRSASELFAETMAANMTRETNLDGKTAMDFYYDETREYFDKMILEMVKLK